MTPKPSPNRLISTNRVFWLWHFWVGLLLGPLIIIIAGTGAIYVFKDELEQVLYPELISESDKDWRSANPLDVAQVVTSVLRENPSYRLHSLELEYGTGQAPALGLISEIAEPRFRRIFVTGDFQTVKGELARPNFFSVVLDLHRNLVIGTPGRVLMELAACWLIVSSFLGIYLWWPKNWRSLAGPFVSYAAYHHPTQGSLIQARTIWETPPMVVWLLWNYPLHVGSFGGAITSWLWLGLAIRAQVPGRKLQLNSVVE